MSGPGGHVSCRGRRRTAQAPPPEVPHQRLSLSDGVGRDYPVSADLTPTLNSVREGSRLMSVIGVIVVAGRSADRSFYDLMLPEDGLLRCLWAEENQPGGRWWAAADSSVGPRSPCSCLEDPGMNRSMCSAPSDSLEPQPGNEKTLVGR